MSSRRTAVVAASVAVLALLAGGVWFLTSGDEGGSALPLSDGVAQDVPGTVLLVPGYGGGAAGLEVLAERLRAQGRTATVVALPGDGTGDLREAAGALDAAADAALADGAPSIDVVGFSAGGVTARIWAGERDGADVARRIVTLGSPHAGTQVAALALAFAPASCPVACQQLVAESDLLSSLEATPDGPLWTSVWTTVDEVVTPPESARLDGAINVVVQDVCADSQVPHGGLPGDPAVTGIVLRALDVQPLTEPPAASACGDLRATGAAGS